jgi:hypothetical protein
MSSTLSYANRISFQDCKYEQMKRSGVRGIMYSHIKLSKHVTEKKVQLAPRKAAITAR